MNAMLAVAIHLADLLERENTALARLDLPSAAALLGAKRAALADFEQAGAKLISVGASLDPEVSAALRVVALRLVDASQENKCLLERAMKVQQHIMSLLAQAAERAAPRGGYGVRGTHVGGTATMPYALLARA